MDITLRLDDAVSANVQTAFETINSARVARGQTPYDSPDAYLTQEVTDIAASYGAVKTAQRQADPKAQKIAQSFGKATDAEFQAYLTAAAAALKVDLSAVAAELEPIK